MTTEMEQYFEATDRVYQQLGQMIDAEQEKRVALLDHNMDRLSEILRNQQAMGMKLEGFEKRRIQTQRDAGFGDMTSGQVLEQLTGQTRTEAEVLFTKLARSSQELRELNQMAVAIADAELKMIDRLLHTPADDANGLYTSGGKKGTGRGPGAAFEEKI